MHFVIRNSSDHDEICLFTTIILTAEYSDNVFFRNPDYKNIKTLKDSMIMTLLENLKIPFFSVYINLSLAAFLTQLNLDVCCWIQGYNVKNALRTFSNCLFLQCSYRIIITKWCLCLAFRQYRIDKNGKLTTKLKSVFWNTLKENKNIYIYPI